MSTLPADADREALMAVHMEVLRIESLRAAALWLATFPAAEQPLALIDDIAREWIAVNREAAARWLAHSPLPAERRADLLAAAPGEGGSP